MARILVVEAMHPVGLDLARERDDIELDVLAAPTDQELARRIVDADAVAIRTFPLRAETIAKAERLKVVARHGVGYDSVDVAALTRRKTPLAVVGNVNAVTVAEHTLFMMLTLAKRGFAHDRCVREGDWGFRNRFVATELDRKRVLIAGFGRIGRNVARRCAAFGMRVEVYDPFVAESVVYADGYHYVADFAAALPDADFVTLHMPASDETRRLMSARAIATMKTGAIVINAARGGLVDETALAGALKDGRLAGAGLDVFADEPPRADNPLLGLDTVVLSPHVAGLTIECARRMSLATIQNAIDAIDGRLDRDLVVNPEVYG